MGTMRDIKYRAWDKRTEKMFLKDVGVKPYHCTFKTNMRQDDFNNNYTPVVTESYSMISPHSKRYVLMQYTGLKDKNGTEIYEGDIIREGDRGTSASVYWENDGFTSGNCMPGCGLATIADICEVLGNIYENPNEHNNNSI